MPIETCKNPECGIKFKRTKYIKYIYCSPECRKVYYEQHYINKLTVQKERQVERRREFEGFNKCRLSDEDKIFAISDGDCVI